MGSGMFSIAWQASCLPCPLCCCCNPCPLCCCCNPCAQQEKLLRKKLVVDQIVDSFAFLKRIAAEYSASTMESWSCFQQQLQSCLSQIAQSPQCSAVQPHAMDYLRVVANPSWATTVSSTYHHSSVTLAVSHAIPAACQSD